MIRTNTPAEEAAARNRNAESPEDARIRRHEAQSDAAARLDASPARLGAELAGEKRPDEETETAEALKRAAENDPRV